MNIFFIFFAIHTTLLANGYRILYEKLILYPSPPYSYLALRWETTKKEEWGGEKEKSAAEKKQNASEYTSSLYEHIARHILEPLFFSFYFINSSFSPVFFIFQPLHGREERRSRSWKTSAKSRVMHEHETALSKARIPQGEIQ